MHTCRNPRIFLQRDCRTLKRVSLKLPEEHRYYRMQDMIAIFRDKEFTNLVWMPSSDHSGEPIN